MWRERGRVSASSADVEWFKNGDFLKGLTEFLDMSLGDLVEGIALHAFEGKAPFTPDTLAKIEQLKAVYGLSLTAADAHRLEEKP